MIIGCWAQAMRMTIFSLLFCLFVYFVFCFRVVRSIHYFFPLCRHKITLNIEIQWKMDENIFFAKKRLWILRMNHSTYKLNGMRNSMNSTFNRRLNRKVNKEWCHSSIQTHLTIKRILPCLMPVFIFGNKEAFFFYYVQLFRYLEKFSFRHKHKRMLS